MMVYFQLERIIPTDVRIKDICGIIHITIQLDNVEKHKISHLL